MAEPNVTVLMPVHNAASFLGEALDSVFAQTYTDFEIVLVDDASTDGIAEVLAGYADRRLRILRHAEQGGTAVALNSGVQAARGRFIAQMHADDIALPDRLERQIDFLHRNPGVGIVGGNQQPVGPDGRSTGPPTSLPTLPGHVRWMLHVHNCLNHPTVVVRREVMERVGGYRPESVPAEDYVLWVQAMEVTAIANIAEVVLRYRVHPRSASVVRAQETEAWAITAAEEALTHRLGAPPDRNALIVLRHPFRSERAPVADVRRAASLLWRFTGAVLERDPLEPEERAAIRRTAVEWFMQLVRATARRRPGAAAGLLAPGRAGPPRWVLEEVAANGWRRLTRPVAR